MAHTAEKPHHHGHESCSHPEHTHATGLHTHPVVKNMRVALILNIFFTCIEFIGGLYTNSVAILSDAIHDLGDSIAIGASLLLEKYSDKGRTSTFSYGKRRFSTLAAFITSLVLLVGSVVILVEAVPRFFTIEPVKTSGMIWLALAGILFNGAAVVRLRSGNQGSLNQRAVMLHLMEDVLGWIAVLAGAIIMYFTKWYWIDPLLSAAIALFIFYNACRNIISALAIFLQATPASVNEQAIISNLKSLPDVVGVHDVHCWTIDGEKNILSLHLVVKKSMDISRLQGLLQKAKDIISAENVQHPTIQVETDDTPCELLKC